MTDTPTGRYFEEFPVGEHVLGLSSSAEHD